MILFVTRCVLFSLGVRTEHISVAFPSPYARIKGGREGGARGGGGVGKRYPGSKCRRWSFGKAVD